MSLAQDKPAPVQQSTNRRGGALEGRSELIVVAVLYAIAVFLAVGTATMNVQGSATPGPQFFPILVCVALFAVATALAISIIRRPVIPDTRIHPGRGNFSGAMLDDLSGEHEFAAEHPAAGEGQRNWKTYSDWRTVGLVVGGVVVFTAALNILGWILSAAFLFWVICYAMGSKRPGFDVGVSLLFASAVQLAFSAGLGLNLPSGFLGGML
ncbi:MULTISPECIES: tripartite tricarboxylate transporter TctB family protein [unclassified Arthrobacter]|uniref:tripartite tricarboxylate transporter TctB family protein n=1 Tax=unclassified Arthrobacter TaxID=235627 RepID=UPI001D15453E|nr:MULTISPECIES: tripartite tricarboxylate transporter TctB family protein [unclassified Arthrobacter]MCC3277414.1 tripartite tricarboxylate transporter TctB family protein [Arthrobacter sp. zg-Y20]MCC3279990.1 tripartite tricarboxylate transporter TctB family protein [Arthrobacter sp. zg-Y40]MCC9178264.1 tripartite tricarboxylate transporter TctB family protein [Arthrobacter sp. zg-Y750]MDK1317574.1 tripartite tricarboxylate transporter TctB family protein [Arthrobacter sp. zg.Y20]MDK1328340.